MFHEKDRIIDNCNKVSKALNKCFTKLKKYLKLKSLLLRKRSKLFENICK